MEGFNQALFPSALILGGLVAGFIFEKIVLSQLRRLADKTKWEGDEILISSIRGMTIVWFAVAGIYGAIFFVPLDDEMKSIIVKGLLIIITITVTLVIGRIATGLITHYAQKAEGTLPLTSISSHLAKLLIFGMGILVVLQLLGIPITPMLTALGVGGLAVALALQDTLSNLFSGLHIIFSGQVQVGDYIRLDSGEEGYVRDIHWRNTTIQQYQNNIIVVPNSKLASAIIVNYNQPEKMVKAFVEVGVGFDSDLGKVERATLDVAREVMREVAGGIPDSEPVVRFSGFGDYAIKMTVLLFAQDFSSQFLVRHEFVKRLHERYKREGIVIPYPQRTVHVREAGKG